MIRMLEDLIHLALPQHRLVHHDVSFALSYRPPHVKRSLPIGTGDTAVRYYVHRVVSGSCYHDDPGLSFLSSQVRVYTDHGGDYIVWHFSNPVVDDVHPLEQPPTAEFKELAKQFLLTERGTCTTQFELTQCVLGEIDSVIECGPGDDVDEIGRAHV